MKHETISGIALHASRVCLGTGSYGTAIPRDDAFKLLDTFAAGEPFLAHCCVDPNFEPV